MKSLHPINHHRNTQMSQHSRHGTEFKIKKVTKENTIDTNTVNKELDRLFIINDQKDFAIKKRTLRILHQEE